MNTYKVIGINGKEYGPADIATLRAWVAEGRIGPDTQILAVGTAEWKPARLFPELGVKVTSQPTTTAPEDEDETGSDQPSPRAGTPQQIEEPGQRTSIAGLLLLAFLVAVVMIVILPSLLREYPPTSVPITSPPQTPVWTPEKSRQRSSDHVQRYRDEAEQGKAEAQYYLGTLYSGGIGVPKDYAEAAKWYRKAAEQGYVQAQYQLGAIYSQGQGVTRDYDEAARWYRMAAEKGYAPAQHFLGHLMANGRGLTAENLETPDPSPINPEKPTVGQRDYTEAVKWWRRAADQGDAGAQNDLGVSYANGQGVERDYAEAAKWYRKAAEKGNTAGMHALAWSFAHGQGVQRDWAEAIKWYRKAADTGYAPSQNDLAWTLATATDASVRDGPLAVRFAEKAVAATRRTNASYLDTLAAAHAESGDFAQAVAIQKEAITLLKDDASKQSYTSRLRLYEAATPYHEE